MRLFSTSMVLLSTAAQAAAAVLGTLEQPSAGYDVVSYNAWQASSFNLAEDAGAYRVRQVSLHMAQLVPNAHLVLRITGSAFGRPDNSDVRAVLLRPPVLAATPGVVSFTAAASPDPLLLPGQMYWLVLGITALDHEETLPAGLVRWNYAATSVADAPAAAGWSVACCTASSGTAGADWQASANSPFLFAINARPPGAAVPVLPNITATGSTVLLTARGTPDVNYEIESSNSLAQWTGIGSAFADASGLIRFSESVGPQSKYYRFR